MVSEIKFYKIIFETVILKMLNRKETLMVLYQALTLAHYPRKSE